MLPKIDTLHRASGQTLDTLSRDRVISAGPHSASAAADTAKSFREYLEKHKSEIAALQILYTRAYHQRLTGPMLKELERKLREEHPNWTNDGIWDAFAASQPAKVRGRSQAGRFADLVSPVRFTLAQQPVLHPFAESVQERFNEWLMD
jgi:type I restriction enzyme, R subunit